MTAALSSLLQLTPFRIEPRFVPRIWGYRDLRPWFDRSADADPIGEVWLTGDDCVVATGSHAGKRLEALFAEFHHALVGAHHSVPPGSPLLIKVIFARQKLSVQVHPDDEMAQKYGFPRGKTECWYALDAEPDAQVALGLKEGTKLDQIKREIEDGTLESSLNVLPVAAGDLIFVDAGTVHAIWPGSILLEVQQNCDLTYRLFDYGRARELHIEKSLEAIKLHTLAGKLAPQALADRTVLVDTEYFRMERIPVDGGRDRNSLRGDAQAGLSYLFAAAGTGRIAAAGVEPLELPAHSIAAIPASSPEFVVEDLGGLDLIRIVPNWPGKQS